MLTPLPYTTPFRVQSGRLRRPRSGRAGPRRRYVPAPRPAVLLLRSSSCLHPRVARARDAPIESAMRPRHPPLPKLPKLWLFSDARAETDLADLAALLPPGSGIIFRHDGLARGPRWRLLRRPMRKIGRAHV